MTVELTYLHNKGTVEGGIYKESATRDTFGLKEEELIRNEIINVLFHIGKLR